MGVTLAKGGNVSLSKAAPNLTQVMVGLGWDARSTTGAHFDLDASALLCQRGGCSATSSSSSTTTSRARTARSSTPATTSPVRARATTSRF